MSESRRFYQTAETLALLSREEVQEYRSLLGEVDEYSGPLRITTTIAAIETRTGLIVGRKGGALQQAVGDVLFPTAIWIEMYPGDSVHGIVMIEAFLLSSGRWETLSGNSFKVTGALAELPDDALVTRRADTLLAHAEASKALVALAGGPA